MVSKAVMDACDTMKEGFLNNPRACTFDFSKLACKGADTRLAASRRRSSRRSRRSTAALKNSKGELIFSGQALGNPLPALRGIQPGGAPGGGFDTVRIWGFQNANYDWNTFDLDRDMPIINSKVGFVDAVDPDLSKFKARGGKLLLYAGWGDTGDHAREHGALLRERAEQDGPEPGRLREAVHGAGHGATAAAATGPNTFDTIGTMEAWREKNVTPTQMMGFNPQSSLSRPICAYPQYARVQGHGQHQGRLELVLRGAADIDAVSLGRLQ